MLYNRSQRCIEDICHMFGDISSRYDLFNQLASLGVQSSWRKYFLKKIFGDANISSGVDIGTGTGDIILDAMRFNSSCSWTGIDISVKMLDRFRLKLRKSNIPVDAVSLFTASVNNIPIKSNTQDVVTSAFVIRNIKLILPSSFMEAYRVLKQDGRIAFMDLYQPVGTIFSRLYCVYFNIVLPFIAKCLFSSKNTGLYLVDSIRHCPTFVDVEDALRTIGFRDISHRFLFFNSVIIYSAKK